MMKAAVVKTAGQPPVYADFDKPAPLSGHLLVNVTASALSQVTRAKAAGTHYSSTATYPFVAGIDGTGRLEDGQRVYFFAPRAPFGAMAEQCLIPDTNWVLLPDELDEITAATIAIPGMSSWAALVERARFVTGETVLVNGATGTSGRLAVQIAKYLGARKVIATGRNAAVLESLHSIGADETISLTQDEQSLSAAFEAHFCNGVDIVLDYLWGTSAYLLLLAAAKVLPGAYPLRFVQIGSISGADMLLPSAVLRSAAITLLGSGIGSIALPRLLNATQAVLNATVPARLQVDMNAVPLSDLAAHWAHADSLVRTVFTMDV